MLFNSDLHTNDTFLTAEPLQTEPGYPANSQYQTVASLAGPFGAEYLPDPGTAGPRRAVRRPDREPDRDAGQRDLARRLGLRCRHQSGARPDPAQRQRHLLVQATGLTPGATYYLRVSAAPAPAGTVGNYSLVADFAGVPAQVQTFVGGTLSPSDPQDEYTLYVAQTQLFQFVLSSSTVGMATGAQVIMQIYDSTGQLVFTLVGRVGETVSGASVLLTPGQYQVQFSVVNAERGGAAVDRLSAERGQSLGPDRPGPDGPDR